PRHRDKFCGGMFMTTINYRTADVEGLKVFYREAGRTDAPMLLLLHGFPSAGHMFRELMPQLAEQFHVVAPDFPGFGQSDMPDRDKFHYTFDNIARVINRFTEIVSLKAFCDLRIRLWGTDWLSVGIEASRAYCCDHFPERERL